MKVIGGCSKARLENKLLKYTDVTNESSNSSPHWNNFCCNSNTSQNLFNHKLDTVIPWDHKWTDEQK